MLVSQFQRIDQIHMFIMGLPKDDLHQSFVFSITSTGDLTWNRVDMQLRFANLNDDDSNDRRSDQKALVAARQPRAINDHQFTGPQSCSQRWPGKGVEVPCSNCGKGYHRPEVCRQPGGGAFRSYQASSSGVQGGQFHQGGAHQRPQSHQGIRCFNRGLTGHMKKDCRRPARATSARQAHLAQQDGPCGSNHDQLDHRIGKKYGFTCRRVAQHIASLHRIASPHRIVKKYAFTCRRAALHIDSGADGWYLDSGATDHMCFEKHQFSSYKAISPIAIHIANHAITNAVGIGEVALHASTDEGVSEITLQEVLHVPELRANLISIRKIAKKKFSVVFDGDHCKLFSSQGELIALGKSTLSDLYKVICTGCKHQVAADIIHQLRSMWLSVFIPRHQLIFGISVLVHLNGRSLQLLHQHKMVTGLDAASNLTGNCVGCVLGKHHRKTFSSLPASHQRQARLELVHTDLCGPMDESSLGGKHYLLTFIDDCTRRAWACFLQAKIRNSAMFSVFQG